LKIVRMKRVKRIVEMEMKRRVRRVRVRFGKVV
jgi:hypothetical protein